MGWCCSRCRCHYRRILVMFVWQRIKTPNATNEFVLFFSFGVFQEEQRASSAMNIIICRHFSVMDCAKRWSFPKVILDALCRRRRHRRRCQKFAICTTSAIPVVRTHNYFDSIFMCVRCGFCQTHNLVIICNNKNNTRRQNVRLAFNISDASRLELDLLYCSFFFATLLHRMQSHCLVERNIWFLVPFSVLLSDTQSVKAAQNIQRLSRCAFFIWTFYSTLSYQKKPPKKWNNWNDYTGNLCVREPTGRPTKKLWCKYNEVPKLRERCDRQCQCDGQKMTTAHTKLVINPETLAA